MTADEILLQFQEQARLRLRANEVSAYIELPVGVHAIGDKKYTVVETVDQEGTPNEYRRNVIELIEPAAGAAE